MNQISKQAAIDEVAGSVLSSGVNSDVLLYQ